MKTNTLSNQFEYRTRFSFVWNYEKDETWLTDLSAQGLHLLKPGVFCNRFEKNSTVRYVYRMDYQKISGTDKLDEYKALFEDSGWEHVDSLFGWHYFRKPFREEESYDIYTDRLSLKLLFKRVQLTLGVVALANLVLLLVNAPKLFTEKSSQVVGSTMTFLVPIELFCVLLLAYGCLRFQQKIKNLDEQ
ncbi:DUF2812 domain-containing protein [Paenibacillus sp. 5J-6]|uniref:DUF2812 domain-containing protein n=1 Tax=Paenibacillus silvestris TaxID=2606219 RepID=A0A6L8V9M1_9BACL|nr:DUF2812 domain-containing protein [Paenibacillus silvestris]MZQ87027.1 DUF2812 domain-containing protein [Paenibacillus silvestris]